jgi:choline dehydrogenase
VERFDVVVLGGGTAGCVLAARLSEEPERRVCLVEAGPDYGPYEAGAWPADILDARALAFSHSWATDREDRSQLRARIMGGCSSHNACVLIEGAPADYDWGPGWSYGELEPYLRRAERQLRMRKIAREELSPWHRAWADAAGDDALLHPANTVGSVRWNAAFAYVDPARSRPNLTILAETLVDRVESGVAKTSRGDLGAETIVVAAGAYGSAGILLRSGLGDELPVGEGLIDHVGAGIGWEPTAALQDEVADFEAAHPLFMAQVTVRAREAELFLFPALEPGYEISGAAFAMKPFSRGRVSLNSDDPEAPLRIEHGFLSDERDVDSVAQAVERQRALAATPEVSRYIAREVRPGPAVSAEAHARAAARGFFHPVGTCAMGSVVDERGRVLGHEGLVVADASVIPDIPRANTNLTVAALAERIAEWL